MNRNTAIFTVVAKNYLPYARVLMRSAAEQHPDWRRIVVLVDEVDGYFDPAGEDFELVLSRELPIPKSRWFHFKYTILELSTAVKPYVFDHLFASNDLDRIIYLDPDIRLYSPLDAIGAALDSANIVLTPHLTGPLEDDRRPAEIDILRSGSYNLGFIAAARSTETASFLAWWQQKLYDHCVVDLARGLFVDQRWIDLAPGMFEGVSILRDPCFNVAYWNLSHRILARSQAGYEVAGMPLVFFHFSGYDPDQPEKVSKHQNRFRTQDLPAATQQLLRGYHDELLAAGYETCRKWPYAFGAFQNGVHLPDMARPVHHEAPEVLDSIEDPFSNEGFEAFLKVWNAPIQPENGSRAGISRLAYRIYRTRTDVQSAMPDIFGGNYKRFLKWILVSGRVEHGLGDVFLKSVSDAMRTWKNHRETVALPENPASNALSKDVTRVNPEPAAPVLQLTRLAAAIYQSRPELQNYFPDPCGRDSARFLIWLLTYGRKEHHLSPHHIEPLKAQWRSVVQSLPSMSSRLRYHLILQGMAASIHARAFLARLQLAAGALWASRSAPEDIWPGDPSEAFARAGEFGVNLVGYFRSETGVGQSVRAAYQSLRSVGVPVSLRGIAGSGPSSELDQTVGPMSTSFPYSTNLFYVNADQTDAVRTSLGRAFYKNRHNIGFWTWELDEFPDRWATAFAPYQEIWTPSTFCRNAIGRKGNVPVFRVPYAVAAEAPAGVDRQAFGLAPEKFIFLAAFDVLSVMERKNPIAAVQAFNRAFGDDPQFQLVLKVNHAETDPRAMDKLRSECSGQSVRIMDSTLSREEMYALTRCADCAVSLHRSEGFGLFIAESMILGKPVIVTNYSGNTDFTRSDNSLLVDYKLIPVGRNCEPYDRASLWADPDVDQAASHMKAIATNPDLHARLCHAGQHSVRSELSPQAVGETIRQRLSTVPISTATAAVAAS